MPLPLDSIKDLQTHHSIKSCYDSEDFISRDGTVTIDIVQAKGPL